MAESSPRNLMHKIYSNGTAQENGVTENALVCQTKSSMETWKAEHDQRLLLLRTENKGMVWEKFVEKFSFPGRSLEAVRKRYQILTKLRASSQTHSSVGVEDDMEGDWETSPDVTPDPADRIKRTLRRQSSSEEDVPRKKILRLARSNVKEFQPEISTPSPETVRVSGHSPSGIASVTHDPASICDNGINPEEYSDMKLVRQLFGPKHWPLVVEEAKKRETERKEAETVRIENLTLKAELEELKERNSRYQKMEEIQRLISEVTKSGERQNPLDSAGNGISDGHQNGI